MKSLTTRALVAAIAMTAAAAALPTPAQAATGLTRPAVAPLAGAAAPASYVVCENDHDDCVAAPARGWMEPRWHRTCGWVSCTIYFNRHETEFALAAGGVVLSVLGKFGGMAGWAVSTVVGPVAAVAFAHGMCLKVKFGVGWSTPLTPFTPLPYSDGRNICR